MSEQKPRPLPEIRAEIDAIDAQVVEWLNRRTELAMEVGRKKVETGAPFFNPEREKDVLEKVRKANRGPLTPHQVVSIFREIISAARASEQTLNVAFWGPDGSYSHQAARLAFGESARQIPVDSIDAVFEHVHRGECQYGVVPVENSAAGAIPETLDAIARFGLKVCAEHTLPIRHCLLSHADNLREITKVFAGPQPSSQCRQWLRTHLNHAEVIEVVPTSAAVQMVNSHPGSAAIAPELASEIYGVPVLTVDIQDSLQNRTRFWILGPNEPKPTGADKTSLSFRVGHRPGELYRALGIFDQNNVNLTMLESRSIPGRSFEYMFFCDCLGHQDDSHLAAALAGMRSAGIQCDVLGSYPIGE